MNAAGPGDFNAIDLLVVAQSEMERLGRLRQIAARTEHLACEDFLTAVDADYRANCIAIALGSAQAEFDVVPSREFVLEEIRLVVEIVGNNVELSRAAEIGGHR